MGVRGKIQDSLQIVFKHVCQSHQGGRLPYSQPIRESVYWTLFNFHLQGFGDYSSDAASALEVLYEAGTLGEESWRAWGLLRLLHTALRVPIPDTREDIFYWTACARATEGFTQRLLTPCFEESYHRRVNSERRGAGPESLDAFEALADPQNPGFYAHVGIDGVLDDYGSGNTVLHIASIYGCLDVAKFAVENHAADVNAQNEASETALMFACRYGRTDIANYLLDNGADASIKTPTLAINALYWLSSFPSDVVPEMACKLIMGGASLQHLFLDEEKHVDLFSQSQYLFTGHVLRSPILRAIGNGDLATTKFLFRIGIEVLREESISLVICRCFLQPMRLAALFHHHDILEYLCCELEALFKAISARQAPSTWIWQPDYLGQFSDIVKTDAIPREALDMEHHIERLCIHGENWETACVKTLEVLLKYGLLGDTIGVLTPDGRECTEWTLMACIQQYRNTAALRFLASHQMFASQVNQLRTYPGAGSFYLVDAALDCGNLEAFRVLVDAGAELNLALRPNPAHRLSPAGASYLHVCASLRVENVEFVERILEAGVPPDVADKTGLSALTMAIMKGAYVVAERLMEKGASVNSPGPRGYTSLGFLLEPVNSAQCDDLVESVRYLLNLTGPNAPSFIVREGGVPVLGLAANAYDPSGPEIECFRMLLDRFSAPEQINAKGLNPPHSTPLQVAISNHNLSAVKALIKTGVVDLSSPDHYGKTPMDQAIFCLNKLRIKKSALSLRDLESELSRAREIISLIATTRSWPSNALISTHISSVLSSCSELMATMKTLPHHQRKQAGLLSALITTINTIGSLNLQSLTDPQEPMTSATLGQLVEFARQLNLALSPVAFADLSFTLAASSGPSQDTQWLPARSDLAAQTAITAFLPPLKSLTLKSFRAWRQAALFEFVLEQVRLGTVDADHGAAWRAFERYVASGCAARNQLPYDAEFVRYPLRLLEWYEDKNNYAQLDLREAGQREKVEGFVEGLRKRRVEEVEKEDGGEGRKKTTLTPFSEEFERFHFFDVDECDGTVILLDIDRIVGALGVTTQCICMKPGEEIGNIATAVVGLMDLLVQQREGCFKDGGGGGWKRNDVRSRLIQMEAGLRAAERDFERMVEQLKSDVEDWRVLHAGEYGDTDEE